MTSFLDITDVFLHFLVEYPLLMKNQLDATLGMLSFFFLLSNIQNGRHCSLENFKMSISQLLGYIET